jgi:hypothetical protein
MRRSTLFLLAASLFLASCGNWSTSRLNPGNWFGRSRSVQAADATEVNPLIPARTGLKRKNPADRHVLIDTISELRVERTNSGAIIRATGIASRQGAYDAVLMAQGSAKGVLTYSFEIVNPVNLRPVGSERSRTVTAARILSNQDLQGIRMIRVTGARNSRETRRR